MAASSTVQLRSESVRAGSRSKKSPIRSRVLDQRYGLAGSRGPALAAHPLPSCPRRRASYWPASLEATPGGPAPVVLQVGTRGLALRPVAVDATEQDR